MKKIVNMKRFVISNIVLWFMVFMAISSIVNIAYSHDTVNYKTLYIAEGDTLWKIAEAEQKNNPYYENKDIRDIIYDIKDINNLQVSNLTVGQEIKIPIK